MPDVTDDLRAMLFDAPDLWGALEGSDVVHKTLGPGKIVTWETRGYLWIQFHKVDGPKKFTPASVLGHLRSMDVPDEVWAALRRRAEKENALAEGRRHLRSYAQKYQLSLESLIDSNGPTALGVLILKLEADAELTKRERQQLDKAGCHQALQAYALRHAEQKLTEYKHRRDGWNLVQACSLFREANQPRRALQESDAAAADRAFGDSRARSALETSRGGAHRDRSDLKRARECAETAARIDVTVPHPHNLLAAICFMEGDHEGGYAHLKEAEKLGALRNQQDKDLQDLAKRLEVPARAALAAYLYAKDPERFKWAKTFASHK